MQVFIVPAICCFQGNKGVMECLNNGTEQCDYASACECCELNEARRADSMMGILVFGTWYCILNEIQTSQPLNL